MCSAVDELRFRQWVRSMDSVPDAHLFIIMYDRLLRRVYRATCTVVDDYMKTFSRLLRYDVTMTK